MAWFDLWLDDSRFVWCIRRSGRHFRDLEHIGKHSRAVTRLLGRNFGQGALSHKDVDILLLADNVVAAHNGELPEDALNLLLQRRNGLAPGGNESTEPLALKMHRHRQDQKRRNKQVRDKRKQVRKARKGNR